jgi:hypothetical protein
MSVIDREQADVLLEGAQQTGYRYPPEFSGFTATLQSSVDAGAQTVSVAVGAEGVSVAATEGLDSWAPEQVRSMVGHRLGRTYDEGDGRHSKRVVEDDHILGSLVQLDDGMSSSYRVADGQIALVTRQPGPKRFSIAVQSRVQTEHGSYLPAEFAVFYWGLDGSLEASEAYSDTYAEVDSLFLPEKRRVIRADGDGVSARLLTLTDHVLMAGVGS